MFKFANNTNTIFELALSAVCVATCLALPVAGLAQTKPTYSDNGKVEGFFGVRNEACVAQCAGDSECIGRCSFRRLTPEELREILRAAKPSNPDQH